MADLVRTIREDFPSKKIVILGDLVADQFLNGTISRVSREAPVFILRHDNTQTLPGAAANAAANVASLGGRPLILGIAGKDANGSLLLAELEKAGVDCSGVIVSENRSTTTKIRVLAGQHYAARQQVIRIDYETEASLSENEKQELKQRLKRAGSDAAAIIISDYNYGAVFPEIFAEAREIADRLGIPIVVDSRNRLTEFPGATSATPNSEEAEQVLGANFGNDECAALAERLNLHALVVTNGNRGMTIYERGRPSVKLDAVGSLEPVDVTGAGDTVIAAYALGLACGLGFADAARIANHAGGIVVMKKRTARVSSGELLESISRHGDALAAETSN